jgi:glutathione S-transferase
MLTLYHFESSPWCWKVRVALAEKGLEYKPVIPKNRESDPGFKKLTPIGKVPVLVLEDGTGICESTVINEFLEERYPRPPLMPADPADRARVRMIEEIGDACLAPALRLVQTARYRFEAGKLVRLKTINKAQEADGLAQSARWLDYLNDAIEGQEFFVTTFSLADIGLTPMLCRTAPMLDLPMAQRWPHLAAWAERHLARPSVSTTRPPAYQFVDEA